jgi:hypothetical protein
MKTIEEIINSAPIFSGHWDSQESVLKDFDITYDDNVKILFANYERENYEGYAWVLFTDGNDLFEVNGTHCSCFGLENQWHPEFVVLTELANRMVKGMYYLGNAKSDLYKFLNEN